MENVLKMLYPREIEDVMRSYRDRILKQLALTERIQMQLSCGGCKPHSFQKGTTMLNETAEQ